MTKNTTRFIEGKKVLVTGGAGFIGSNLCTDLLEKGNTITCLDNFSTGSKDNISELIGREGFHLIEGDIRNLDDCLKATENQDIVLHQAALGSVPRSINDPISTNESNITGFLNILVACRDNKVGRVVYAASSSTYGDSKVMPKVEDVIGKPLSPYAVTKYVNELYAHVFHLNYGMQIIGLRYFNVFGRKQSPDGAYAAVIPKFIQSLIRHEPPVINGDGSFSRDFTYVDNIILINHLAATTTNKDAIGQVFNAAAGQRTDLNTLVARMKEELSAYDNQIAGIEPMYGPERKGDVPHSMASIDKAKNMLMYSPSHTFEKGLKEAIGWYWNNLK